MRVIFSLVSVGVLSLVAAAAPATALGFTEYSTDFEAGAGPEWSLTGTSVTPAAPTCLSGVFCATRFLGEFGTEDPILTLSGLQPHTQVEIHFDLFVIRTSDGNGVHCCGPDLWGLSVDGTTVFESTFRPQFGEGDTGRQSYPAQWNAVTPTHNLPCTAFLECNTLGYAWSSFQPADGVIGFPNTDHTMVFAHSASTLSLAFLGGFPQGIGDESWGIDNVVIKTDHKPPVPVPEMGTVLLTAMGALAIAGVAAFGRRRA